MNGLSANDVGIAGLSDRVTNDWGRFNHGNFAGDGSAVNANVVANRDAAILNGINTNSRDGFLGNQIDRGHAAINDNINTTNQFLSDRIWSQGIDAKFQTVANSFASMERLAIANKADTDRQLHSMELKQVECCCELKAGQASILAKLDADALRDSQSENMRLRIQIENNNRSSS